MAREHVRIIGNAHLCVNISLVRALIAQIYHLKLPHEASGVLEKEIATKRGISVVTIFARRPPIGPLVAMDIKHLCQLEQEHTWLKTLADERGVEI